MTKQKETRKKITSLFLTKEAFDKMSKHKQDTKMRIYDLFFLLSINVNKSKKLNRINKEERRELKFRNLDLITDLLKREDYAIVTVANDLILTAKEREVIEIKIGREAEELITKKAKEHKLSTRAYLSAMLDLRLIASNKSKKSLDKMIFAMDIKNKAHFKRKVFVTKETAEALKLIDTQMFIDSLVFSGLGFMFVEKFIQKAEEEKEKDIREVNFEDSPF